MKISSIRVQNFRSFADSGQVDFGQINVLVGANNSGKSTILKAVYLLQGDGQQPFADVRVGTTQAAVTIEVTGSHTAAEWGGAQGPGRFEISVNSANRREGSLSIELAPNEGARRGLSPLPAQEPGHLIVPFLTKRKTLQYQEDVR